jgi:hypothetical protein
MKNTEIPNGMQFTNRISELFFTAEEQNPGCKAEKS